MICKRFVLIFFIFFSLLLYSNSKLKVIFKLSDDFIFNNKILLNDLTEDIKKYLNHYDNSTDLLLKSNRFIYEKDDLEKINTFIQDLSSYFIEKLTYLLNKNKNENENENGDENNILIVQDDAEDVDNKLSITIKGYFEGEYNLIRNKPSEVLFIAEFFRKKNEQEKQIFKFTKRYKLMASIDYPTEKLRGMALIDKMLSELLKKIDFSEKENISKTKLKIKKQTSEPDESKKEEDTEFIENK